MKKLVVLIALVALYTCTFAQDTTDKFIDPNIPQYRILTTDSVYTFPGKLKKDTRVMIIYFSPDCPHCQHLTNELKPRMKELGNTQIVMITWSMNHDIRAIKTFYRDFGLKAYHNIIVGTEGYDNTVMKYYHVTTTPFIAIYNRKGKMVKSFDKQPKAEDVIAAVKKA